MKKEKDNIDINKAANAAAENVGFNLNKPIDIKKAVEVESAKEVVEIATPQAEDQEKDLLIVELANLYVFDGVEYETLDLTGIKNLTTTDAQSLEKRFYGGGNIAPINEMSTAYTMFVASIATKMPIEFFNALKIQDTVKVKNAVSTFLLS